MGCEWEKMRSQLGPGSRLLISTLWRSMKYILLWSVPWVQVLIVCRIHWCHSAFAQTATYITSTSPFFTSLPLSATPHTPSISIAHGAAPRSDCGGSRATPPAPSNARAARLDGDDLGGRRVEGTLRLATTCYDLAICYISYTCPLHSTLHPEYACSICSLLHFIRLQCEVCHISSRWLWLRPANSWSCANSSVSCDAQSSCARTMKPAGLSISFNLEKRKSEKSRKSQLWHALAICNLISQTDLNRKREKVKKLLEIIDQKIYMCKCVYTYLYNIYIYILYIVIYVYTYTMVHVYSR